MPPKDNKEEKKPITMQVGICPHGVFKLWEEEEHWCDHPKLAEEDAKTVLSALEFAKEAVEDMLEEYNSVDHFVEAMAEERDEEYEGQEEEAYESGEDIEDAVPENSAVEVVNLVSDDEELTQENN